MASYSLVSGEYFCGLGIRRRIHPIQIHVAEKSVAFPTLRRSSAHLNFRHLGLGSSCSSGALLQAAVPLPVKQREGRAWGTGMKACRRYWRTNRDRLSKAPSAAISWPRLLFPIPFFPVFYPRTETPEKESTANPRTGWPKKRAGSKRLNSSRFSTCERVVESVGPEMMRKS